jgi:hypothetical protein
MVHLYKKESKSVYNRDTCTSRLIMALFTVAKLWDQSRCPSTDEWIKKMWYIYTVEYYLVIKTKLCCLQENGQKIIILNKINQTQKGKYHIGFSYVVSKNKKHESRREIIMKEKETERGEREDLLQGGKKVKGGG